MDWVIENWQTIALVLSVVASILTGAGWVKSGQVLTAVIKGVEGARLPEVKQSIRSQATVAGVETTLNSIVKRITEAKS